jgi:hypothetical protein
METEAPKSSARTVSVGLAGGLGNQLFAMAAAFGYGRATNRQPAIDVRWTLRGRLPSHTANRYIDTVFRRFARIAKPYAGTVVYHEPLHASQLGGSRIPAFANAAHVALRGYFVGEHTIRPHITAFVRELSLPVVPPVPNTVFMHVRRGDVVRHPIYRMLYSYDLKEYCERALALVRSKLPGVRIRVFSDDLAWCQAQPMLTAADIEFEDERLPELALMKMAACEAGGICWNSTFSWWAAYLNRNPAKLVTMPLQFNKIMPVDVWPAGAHIISSGPALLANGVFVFACVVIGVCVLALTAVCIWLGVRNAKLARQ